MFKSAWSFLKATLAERSKDKVSKLAAALAYYAIFSIAPLFVIGIAVAGFVYGQQAVQGQIVNQIRGLVGDQGAQMIQTMIAGATKTSSGIIATGLSIVALLFGASGVFSQLKDSLNTIWGVQPKPNRGIMGAVKDQLFAILLVFSAGILLIALMFASSVLWTVTSYFGDILPLPGWVWQVVYFIFSLALLTLIFSLILKFVPDVKIAWKDVWVGAAATALLFVIGQFLIGLYLGRSSFTSSYGIAGSVLLLLVWIYYSAQIFFLGAEMTQVYARRYGAKIEPADNAIPLAEKGPQEQKKAA
jgi:membrane protein